MPSSICERIRRHPAGDRAIVDGAREVSYGELNARVARAAGGLHARGVARGDRVVVLVPMSIELYVALLAIASLGAVAVFVEPAAGAREMARAIRATRPVTFLGVPRAHALRVAVHVPIAIVVGGWLPGATRFDALDGAAPPVALDDSDPALLTFSSGSTGAPKAAVRSHGFLAAQHAAVSRLLDARPGDVHLSSFAIVLLSTLVDGGTAVIGRPGLRVVPDDVTVVSGSPAFLAPLALDRAPRVRRMISGGAPVPVDLVERVPASISFLVVYGSTEAEPIATIDASEVRATAAETRAGAGLCVGLPDPDARVRLIAPRAAPILIGAGGLAALSVARGEVGEVIVSGPHVNQRYYRNPAAERAHKIVDEAGAIWHRTGDAAYQDARGRLWLVGRITDVVRRGDAAYHPTAVEAAARALPWVSRAALIADHAGASLIVERRGRGDPDELTQHLADRGVIVDRIAFARRLPVDARHHAKLDYPRIRREHAA